MTIPRLVSSRITALGPSLSVPLLAVVMACNDGADQLVEPPLVVPVASARAVIERGSEVFTFDDVVWFDCVGEFVHSVVYAPYTYQLVLTPTGEYVYHDLFDTDAVTGTLTGQSSGTVWDRVENVAPSIDRSTGGGMYHFTFKGVFVSETGPELKVHQIFHVSANAQGDVTAELSRLDCRVAD